MNIYLEIFGYIGTALVIVSMMMTSVLKLRIFNMCGGLISLIYAVCVNTWPVVVLNACLISINFVQTLRQLKKRGAVTVVSTKANDVTVKHLLDVWEKDLQKQYPDLYFVAMRSEKIHILYVGDEAIGFCAENKGDVADADNLYLTPAHRTAAMRANASSTLAHVI